MPGDGPFLAALGDDGILEILGGHDVPGHELAEDGSDLLPDYAWEEGVQPVLADDVSGFIAQDLAALPVYKRHSFVSVNRHDDDASDVKVLLCPASLLPQRLPDTTLVAVARRGGAAA